MLIVTRMTEHFLSLDYEDFTAKIIVALTFSNIIVKFNKDDKKRLEEIEMDTHKDILVSIYKLDRAVNPTKGEFKSISNKIKFIRNDWKERESANLDSQIELGEDKIQHYLCMAIREVNQIVFKNLRSYNEDFTFPNEEDDDDKEKTNELGLPNTS